MGGGGGGGRPGNDPPDTAENDGSVEGSQDNPDANGNEDNLENDTTDGQQENDSQMGTPGDGDGSENDDKDQSLSDQNDTETPDGENDMPAEDNVISNGSNALDDISSALIIVSEDAAAPGISDEELTHLSRDYSVNANGDVLFGGNFSFYSDERSDPALWAGPLASPRLLLRKGMAINGFPNTVRLSGIQDSSLDSAGNVAAVVTLGGARSATALLISEDSQMNTFIRSDESFQANGKSWQSVIYDDVEHESGHVAVVARRAFNDNPRLFLFSGDQAHLVSVGVNTVDDVLDEVPLQADGCRILLRNSRTGTSSAHVFDVLADGTVIFEARVTVEGAARFNDQICPDRRRVIDETERGSDRFVDSITYGVLSSIVAYSDGEYRRIVTKGDSVPGMSNAVFKNVSLLRSFDDGSILVSATIGDITINRNEVQSWWLFSRNAETPARLVMIHGETADSSALNETLTIGSGRSRQGLQVNADGSALVLDSVLNQRFEVVQSWLRSGYAHPGQPYGNVSSLGASSLLPVLVTGSPAPGGFADSAFWSSIGGTRLLPDGRGLFRAGIVDAAQENNSVAGGLWMFDSDRTITQVFPSDMTVTINEIPRSISIPDDYRLVGDKGIVFLDSQPGKNRLIYLPFPDGM